jgi:3-oxoacid CoA-transferase subunit B
MPWTPAEMASRLAADLRDGWIVNLGVGLPTLVAERVAGRPILVHAENGVLGVGPPPPEDQRDPDIIDPGKNPVTILPGASFMDSAVSFGLIRGGRLDLAVMGAYQVSASGDLANWQLPGQRRGAIGGAADLAAGARNVWVMTTHVTKDGGPKLVEECSYPLTAARVVTRVYTDFAVLDVTSRGFRICSLAPGISAAELREATAAPVEEAA